MESINTNNDDLKKKIKESFSKDGLEIKTLDVNALKNIGEYYTDNTIQYFINENLPKMLELSPNFLEINKINFNDVDKRIEDNYKNKTELIERYGTNDNVIDSMKYKFKVYFDHLIFYMEEHPNDQGFQEAMKKVKEILDGTYVD